MSDTLSIYFAGDLFDHKHLIGNAILASYIERQSADKYECVVPQDLEQGSNRKQHIRNQDLKMVMEADLGLFNFDGPDLDSGTVVEFMIAKQLDIPSVIIRTDFRNAGDQDAGEDNWNLMCSFYPRTEVISLNSMEWYQDARKKDGSIEGAIEALYAKMAARIIEALDKVRSMDPLTTEPEFIEQLYRWAVKFPGAGLNEFINDESWVATVIEKKKRKGLIG